MSYFRDKGVARHQLGLGTFDGAAIDPPGGDRIMFWDESEKKVSWLSVVAPLSITDDEITVTEEAQTAAIFYVIDGGGAVITTGIKGDVMVPFACTINSATLLADQTGSIVVDVWKDTYANAPPTDADSITASAPPTLSSAVKSQDSTLTGWSKTLAAGDVLRFNVDSVSTVTRVSLILSVTRT